MSSKRSKHSRNRTSAFVMALAVAGALVCGCSKEAEEVPGRVPGILVADAPLLLAGASASLGEKAEVRSIRYYSTSGVDGNLVEVSGMVLIPKKASQPQDGYRLVSYGHGAVGFDHACGPTTTKDFGADDASRIAELLDAGYVVAASDYQGLGAGPAHPFREPKTTGYNLVDAARAAKGLMKKLGKPLSGKWAAYGESQGGQAAWAAGDLAGGYGSRPDGDGLTLVGVAAEKPPTDFSWLVDGAVSGKLGKGDQISYLRLLKGLRVAHPELLLDQYVSGTLAEKSSQDTIFGCFAHTADQVAEIAERLSPEDTALTPQLADRLNGWLQGWKLPLAGEKGPAVPMFVAASLQDEVVPIGTVRTAILEEKKQRLTAIHAVLKAGGRHGEFDDSVAAISWIGDGFAGKPAPDDYAAE